MSVPRRIHVLHHTEYRYGAPVSQSWQLAHLRPRELPGQRVRLHRLVIEPRPDWLEPRSDYFGNQVTVFAIHAAHAALDVIAESQVEVLAPPPDTEAVHRPWDAPSATDPAGTLELAHYLAASPQIPRSRGGGPEPPPR